MVVVTGTFSGPSSWMTGRNRSSAVWPTMLRALSRSFTPGRSMMMLLPCRLISGSATPSESTRFRMMLTAWPNVPGSTLTPCLGASTTEMPPWRSRPSWGVVPVAKTAITGTATSAIDRISLMT